MSKEQKERESWIGIFRTHFHVCLQNKFFKDTKIMKRIKLNCKISRSTSQSRDMNFQVANSKNNFFYKIMM